VIDVASSVSATIAAGGSGGLSPGSTFVISKVKVTIQSQLSEGGFGIVYHAIDSNTNQQYALKQLLCQSSEQVKEAHNEIKVLEVATKGNCQEIVELIDYSSTAIASNDSAGVTFSIDFMPPQAFNYLLYNRKFKSKYETSAFAFPSLSKGNCLGCYRKIS
jgi:serine/threonine protein kinase